MTEVIQTAQAEADMQSAENVYYSDLEDAKQNGAEPGAIVGGLSGLVLGPGFGLFAHKRRNKKANKG